MRGLLLRVPASVVGALLLLSAPAEAEVRLNKPSNMRVEVVSDGVPPWRIGFATFGSVVTPPRLIPAGTDRVFFVHGSSLHLIDSKNGVVIGRWIFPDGIDAVQAEGAGFRVQTSASDPPRPRSTVIGLDLPAPVYWMDNLSLYRLASLEGSWFDHDAHFETEIRDNVRIKRTPLSRQDAERLLLDGKDAARRNPLLARLAVVEALLLKDAGRQEEADAVFCEAIERKTNHYSELFWIAHYLEDVDETAWSGLAFDRAGAIFFEQGSDPRLVSFIIPKLTMGYLPYDLRTEIPARRRAELSERLYRLGPYVQGSSAAWSVLAAYFDENGDSEQAALWRSRAAESAGKTGYIWEFSAYAARTMRLATAFLLSAIVYGVVLHRRYAPQRRLFRQPGWANWLRRRDPRWSLALWDRRDRLALTFVLLLFWLGLGAFGAMGETAALTDSAPMSLGAGSYRAPATRVFLEGLGETPERDFLLGLSLQQQGETAGAESLYRKTPNSARAWNNLGVLQSDQGRVQEAATSFRKALELDPEMSEAALNLGRPTKEYWAGVHQQYLPGQKMLAIPSHDMIYRAMWGPLPQAAYRILRGPFSAARAIKALDMSYNDSRVDSPLPIRIAMASCGLWTWGLSFVLGSCLLILSLSPYREAAAAPARWHWLVELAAPGTSRRWKVWGAIVLALFAYGILETVFHRSYFGTWLFTWPLLGSPSLGLSPALAPGLQNAWPPDVSSAWWSQGPAFLAVLLFAANAVVVLRALAAGEKT